MKKMILIFAFLMSALVNYSQEVAELQYASSPFKTSIRNEIEATGMMMLKQGTWIIRVSDRNSFTDYIPVNLDVNYKVESLQVHFKAVVDIIPENVRMIGTPVRILTIERIE